MTNVAARFRFPFDGCSDTVKSRLPVHFALPSFSLAGERGDEEHDPLPPLLLLFALYSSTFPALTLGEFFSIRVAGRVRVGPILLSLSLSLFEDTRTASRLCASLSFLSRETSDRFFSFFPSSFLQVDFRRGIVTSEKSSIDRFTSYHFCRNLARTFRSSRRFRRVHEHRRSINAGVSKHGKPTNRIPSPRRQENFYDYR